ELGVQLGAIEHFIPMLEQVGSGQWRDRRTGELLEVEDVFERYRDELPRVEGQAAGAIPDWLAEIREAIPVRYIDTERLTHALPDRVLVHRTVRHGSGQSTQRAVRRYARDLSERIQRTLTE